MEEILGKQQRVDRLENQKRTRPFWRVKGDMGKGASLQTREILFRPNSRMAVSDFLFISWQYARLGTPKTGIDRQLCKQNCQTDISLDRG